MTGLPPSWSDLIWNNLRVTLILCGGLVSATLITLFFGSFSLFVTGASFGVAVSELGLLASQRPALTYHSRSRPWLLPQASAFLRCPSFGPLCEVASYRPKGYDESAR